jgi:hypothetical protein
MDIDGLMYTTPIMTTTTTTVQIHDGKKDDFYIKRLSDEEQKKNRDEMLARPDDLFYLSPMLTGYALKNKIWCTYAHKIKAKRRLT